MRPRAILFAGRRRPAISLLTGLAYVLYLILLPAADYFHRRTNWHAKFWFSRHVLRKVPNTVDEVLRQHPDAARLLLKIVAELVRSAYLVVGLSCYELQNSKPDERAHREWATRSVGPHLKRSRPPTNFEW
jgi:hypothetical protein